MSLLEVEALTKSFGESPVLHGLSFALDEGKILGFVGPNGAGKSTCLRCLIGLCFPSAGRVRLAGIDALADPVAARSRVGYLPGEASVYAGMSGHECLAFGLGFYGAIDEELRDRCLAAFELPLDRKVRSWSAGQKQLLALTIALVPRVPLHILDEPDKALDASMRSALRSILRELRARGRTLLISSHHLYELEEVADDLLFLVAGRLVPSALVSEVRERLARRIRVTPGGPRVPPPRLPEGIVWRDEGGTIVVEPEDDAQAQAALRALVALRPRTVDFGHAALEDLYDALYEGIGE